MAEKKCNHYGTESTKVTVPYVVHESSMARAERVIKRQRIAIILLICMLFGAFGLFVWYESLYETISYEQDGEGINNVNLGEQGDLSNGSKGSIQEEAKE